MWQRMTAVVALSALLLSVSSTRAQQSEEAEPPAETSKGAADSDATGDGDGAPAPVKPDLTAGCLEAFGDAQLLRREGKLRQAKEKLITCAQPACHEAIVAKCSQWLPEVRAAIPSIIVVAKDGYGRDLVDVEVIIDGELVTKRLDGLPIELDPGVHKARFIRVGEQPVEMSVVVAQSQKDRTVAVTIGKPPPAPPASPPPVVQAPRPPEESWVDDVSPLVWVGFGVALAGAVVGSVTGGLALSKADDLREACGGDKCPADKQDEHDEGAALAHASTASFVVAGLGLGVGIVALVWLDDDSGSSALLRPLLGPGYAGVAGAF